MGRCLRFLRAFDGAQADDGQAGGRATDHGIVFMQMLGQVGQPHGAGAKLGGQLFAALQRAVGDHDLLGVAGREMGGDQLDHLARAHEQHADLGQVFEQLAGQPHGGSGHADAVGADLGGAAHFLGHREAALEQLVQRAAQGACVLCGAHGVLHLAQDLGLAQHHGIEPAGHAEGMARHMAVFQQIGVRAQQFGRDAAAVGQPVQRMVHGRHFGRAVDLGTVAGGENGGLDGAVLAAGAGQRFAQALQRGHDLVKRERETSPHIKRSRVVVDAECPDCHNPGL